MPRHPVLRRPASAAARHGPITLCLLIAAIWTALVIAGSRYDLWALIGLSIFGAVAFLVGALVSTLAHHARALGYVDAAAAGAMLAAALVLVLPHAVFEHAGAGVLGLLIGLAIGATLHYVGAGRGVWPILLALTFHTLCAGIALGALYTVTPTLGWTVGLALLAHKAPAGYVLARRLDSAPENTILVLLPAFGTGLGALSVAIMPPAAALPAGIIFGAAAGLFVFVALAVIASGTFEQGRSGAEWTAFAIGGTAIAITGLVTSHGV